MNSKITIANAAARVSGTVVTGLLGALLLGSVPSSAQDASELANLIFRAVPLASVEESSIELGPPSAAKLRELADEARRYEARIQRLRERSSTNTELIEQLGFLAVAYQGLNRHEDALEALEEAISLTVDDGGRRNLEQIPLLEQQVPSYLAIGDIRRIDDTEELVYSLYERHYGSGDRQMYYATINLADWLMAAYYRDNYGPGTRELSRQMAVIPRVQRCIRKPGSEIGEGPAPCSDNPIFSGQIRDVFDQDIIDARLRKIDRLYADFQEARLEAGNAQLDIIIDIAKRIARLAFATKQEMDFERDNYRYDPAYDGSREQAVRNSAARMDESYDTGVAALNYAIEVPGSVANWRPEALAAALVDLADWHLAYGKAAAAKVTYARAYQVLLDAGFSSENIDVALAADTPAKIPVFATHLYSWRSTGMRQGMTVEYKGWLDVSYVVDDIGNTRDIRILGRTEDASDEIQRLLERQLRSMKFRPVLIGGELVSPGRVEARYYYAY